MQNPKTVWGSFDRKNTISNKAERLVFRTSNLGWLNCDAFPRTTNNMVSFAVNAPINSTTDYKLYLPDYNGFLRGISSDSSMYFSNIPKGTRSIIIAVKYENDQIFLASQEFNAKNGAFLMPEFKKVSKSDLTNIFKSFESYAAN